MAHRSSVRWIAEVVDGAVKKWWIEGEVAEENNVRKQAGRPGVLRLKKMACGDHLAADNCVAAVQEKPRQAADPETTSALEASKLPPLLPRAGFTLVYFAMPIRSAFNHAFY